jgi:hypothetical protein
VAQPSNQCDHFARYEYYDQDPLFPVQVLVEPDNYFAAKVTITNGLPGVQSAARMQKVDPRPTQLGQQSTNPTSYNQNPSQTRSPQK